METAIADRLWVGANAKYIQEKLRDTKLPAPRRRCGYPIPSLLQNMGFQIAVLALSLRNFGTQLKFVEEVEDLPRTVQGGMPSALFMKDLTLSSDFTKELSAKLSAQVGIEYMAKNVAAFSRGL